MRITDLWMKRIQSSNPGLANTARDIAHQAAQDATYNTEVAIANKLAEWQEVADSQTGRALRYAVLYYQEDIAAKTG